MKTRYSQAYQTLISKLKAARLDAGATQVELAESLGKPQSYVAKIESGERRLDVVEFIHLCDAVQIDPTSVVADLYSIISSGKTSPGKKKKSKG